MCSAGNVDQNFAGPLWELFRGINRLVGRRWYRAVMRYPHFPGEDLVPDLLPLGDSLPDQYRFDRPVHSVEIERVKTFYTGHSIELIERSKLGRIELMSGDENE